ncbi:MAG: hypothetical protein U0270_12660 [Labilithrix sp.]
MVSSPLKSRSAIRPSAAIAAGLLLASLAVVSPAAADEVDRCVAASEKGQKERRAGNLMDARTAFLQCAAEKCPGVVRSACTEWLDQVNASIPTIIVAVTDTDHKDIVDARILVDGKSVALGRAVQLDPGPHTVAAEADGFQTSQQSIVARETEHHRPLSFVLTRKSAETPQAPPVGPAHEKKGISTITWVTGGLTLAALGGFAGFGLRGRFLAADLRDTCAPNCTDDDRSRAQTSYIIADISLIAAVILGGVTIYTFLSNRD